jgi:tripartite-type tricarboxylate transporter receptor subunit TctC
VRRRLFVVATLALAGVVPASAAANDVAPYPNRPIRIVVPNAAGSGDIVPRLLASKLAASLGQPVVVENRPGASFNIASEIAAKAPADGYTLLYSFSGMTLVPHVIGPTAVDPVASFAPIVKLLTIPVVIAVNPALGARTLDELVALARERPGRVAYATGGIGSIPHLAATLFSRSAGIELLHAPYTNIGQAAADVVAGTVPVYFTLLFAEPGAAPVGRDVAARGREHQAHGGAAGRPDRRRARLYGGDGGAVGGHVRAGRHAVEIVDRLNREFNAMLASPDVRERFAQLGLDPIGSTPERFADEIRAQVARWPAIVKAAGIKRD